MTDKKHSGSGLRGIWVAGGLAALLLSLAGPSLGADPSKRFAVTGQAGMGGLRMTDVNGKISDGNRWLEEKGWTTMDPVRLGFDFKWAVSARLLGGPKPGLSMGSTPSAFSISAGGGSLQGRSKLDFDQVITVKPTARYYDFQAVYQIPYRFNPAVILSIGGGPIYANTAKLETSAATRQQDIVGFARTETATFKGSGWGAYGFLQAETVLSEKITLITDVGYRALTVTNAADALTWSITDIEYPKQDDDGDGIQNQYDLNPGTGSGDDSTFLTDSFLEVERDPQSGQIPLDAQGRPTVRSRGGLKLDFSGVAVNVGLRFYLF
jgi:hypothetical protein